MIPSPTGHTSRQVVRQLRLSTLFGEARRQCTRNVKIQPESWFVCVCDVCLQPTVWISELFCSLFISIPKQRKVLMLSLFWMVHVNTDWWVIAQQYSQTLTLIHTHEHRHKPQEACLRLLPFSLVIIINLSRSPTGFEASLGKAFLFSPRM